jgi:type II secretory ATPase GspE/PulE/Tfp pilus assembly ATPase PilB-like protein
MAQFYAFRVLDINERGARLLLPLEIVKLFSAVFPNPCARWRYNTNSSRGIPLRTSPKSSWSLRLFPQTARLSDVARAFPYKKFELYYMKERDLAEYWRHLTAERQQTATRNVEAVSDEEVIELESIPERDISRGQIPGPVKNLFTDAARVSATGFHIVPYSARKTEVFFRIDGQQTLWYPIEDGRTESVAAVVKSRRLNLDRYERLAAQEGSAREIVDNRTVRYRLSVLPVMSSDASGRFESGVIRILRDASTISRLDALGLDLFSLRSVTEVLERRRGLINVVGRAEGGKATAVVPALQSAEGKANWVLRRSRKSFSTAGTAFRSRRFAMQGEGRGCLCCGRPGSSC